MKEENNKLPKNLLDKMSCLELFFLNFGDGLGLGRFMVIFKHSFVHLSLFGIWGWVGFGVAHGTLEDASKIGSTTNQLSTNESTI